jgi:hypothetical protein
MDHHTEHAARSYVLEPKNRTKIKQDIFYKERPSLAPTHLALDLPHQRDCTKHSGPHTTKGPVEVVAVSNCWPYEPRQVRDTRRSAECSHIVSGSYTEKLSTESSESRICSTATGSIFEAASSIETAREPIKEAGRSAYTAHVNVA